MVNDGTESINLANCKTCLHCTKAMVYEWLDEHDIYHRVWQLECNVGGWIDEKDSECGECAAYAHVDND